MLRALAHHVECCCVLLRLVGSCWVKFETGQTSSNNFQQVATTRNNTQHGVQTLATCWAQQCCVLLANNVASVCTGLYMQTAPAPSGWAVLVVSFIPAREGKILVSGNKCEIRLHKLKKTNQRVCKISAYRQRKVSW